MTKSSTEQIECPSCQAPQTMAIFHSINADLNPALREKLMTEGGVNIFTCGNCNCRALVHAPLLYHDMRRRYCVQFLPPEWLEDAASLDAHDREGRMRDIGGMSGESYVLQPHIVFSMEEMVRYILFRELLDARDRLEKDTEEITRHQERPK